MPIRSRIAPCDDVEGTPTPFASISLWPASSSVQPRKSVSSVPGRNRYGMFAAACLDLLRQDAPDEQARGERALRSSFATADPTGSEACLEFLARHRLDQLFLRAVIDRGLEATLSEALLEPLKTARRQRALFVLLQQEAAARAARALDQAGVEHVFFKGFQLGEQLYGDAVLRPSADLDVLIAEHQRQIACSALAEAGFEEVPQEDAPDYEVALCGHGTTIDLHWHLIQPQRCRVPLTPQLLESRRSVDGISFPDAEMGLIVLLLNPAITDHVSDRLIQAVDLDRWIRRFAGAHTPDFDWTRCLDLLSRAGLTTAAWAMLHHTRSLFATPLPEGVERRLRPGSLRRSYLRAWLARDPARIYDRRPTLVRIGFSLWLLDHPRDIVRFLVWYLLDSSS